MNIIHLFPGSFASNCYLLEDSGQVAIVDPSAAALSILRKIEEIGGTPICILLTHGHFDHIMSVDTLREHCPHLPVCIHEADAPMLLDGEKNGFATFFHQNRVYQAANRLLQDGDIIQIGNATVEVFHTPGHSPGSVCYLCREDNFLVTGDTLFADNIGRCDLWGGNYGIIKASLQRLRTLDSQLVIYPGHGETNRLGRALDNTMYY